jgi:hypothetical protein
MKVNEVYKTGKNIFGKFVGMYPFAYIGHGAVHALKHRSPRIKGSLVFRHSIIESCIPYK